jgi:hypothetical protein
MASTTLMKLSLAKTWRVKSSSPYEQEGEEGRGPTHRAVNASRPISHPPSKAAAAAYLIPQAKAKKNKELKTKQKPSSD